jgi:lysyl endopeptidase
VLSDVALHRSPQLDRAALAIEDAQRDAEGRPYRFASADHVSITPRNSGTWEEMEEGLSLWRHRISCPDAISLNLGFTSYYLPAGARLLLYAADGSGSILSFDERDNKGHGQLWTPIFHSSELVIELVVDREDKDRVDLVLDTIGCGYRDFLTDNDEKSQFCEVDVVCPDGDDWRDEIDTVAVFQLGATWKCTGTLMNNTALDGRPLFLTAMHCDVVPSLAASIVVYWNFQSPVCGQQGGGSLEFSQSGSTFLANYDVTDVTLVELDELPDPAFGVKYAGWDRSAADPTSAVAIHHPATDEKSISFENDATMSTSWAETASPGDGNYIMVPDWDVGTTEQGSSGSALFNQDHRVVGQLRGGWASCDNNDPDWYGRLSVSWDGGGTTDSRLSDHLDPLSTGAMTLDLIDYQGFNLQVKGLADWFPSGPAGGPFLPNSRDFVVTNPFSEDRGLRVTSSADWLDFDIVEAELVAGDSVTVAVSLNAAAAELGRGDHTAVLTLTETTEAKAGLFEVVLRVGGEAHLQLLSVGPNPASTYVELAFSLDTGSLYRVKFMDLRGRVVRDLGEFQGVRGTNVRAWNGRGDDGRRLPAGVYIGLIEAGQSEAQARIMLIH